MVVIFLIGTAACFVLGFILFLFTQAPNLLYQTSFLKWHASAVL
jgi:hypothetical protein